MVCKNVVRKEKTEQKTNNVCRYMLPPTPIPVITYSEKITRSDGNYIILKHSHGNYGFEYNLDKKMLYEGHFRIFGSGSKRNNYVREGGGTLHFDDGSILRTTFTNGKPNENGVLWFADNTTFKGTIVDGKPHGRGVFKNHQSIPGNWEVRHYTNKGRNFTILLEGKASQKCKLRCSSCLIAIKNCFQKCFRKDV